MNLLQLAISGFARSKPNDTALLGQGDNQFTWSQLVIEQGKWLDLLSDYENSVLAIYLDNDPLWVIIDLACQRLGIVSLPIPSFFSDEQIKHALKTAGAAHILHANHPRISALLNTQQGHHLTTGFVVTATQFESVELPKTTAKITFTSGTTGQPKGVCLSTQHQLQVAESIVDAIAIDAPVHLSVLPYSTLLENIAGMYSPLLSGGCVVALPMQQLGFNGSSQFDVQQFVSTITQYQPTSLILLPELLMALMAAIQSGFELPSSVKFIAVGGSKVSASLLQQAAQMKLPVYEGYGLSECGSVVALNTPANNRIGCVGKPLAHVRVEQQADQLIVKNSCFLGYVAEPNSWYCDEVKTGDLIAIDQDGYLAIKGRVKNTLISSYGRNINPEWPESELLAMGLFSQAVVFGDAKPFCTAVLFPRLASVAQHKIEEAIALLNSQLPDYAQIKRWLCLEQPMLATQGLYTANGRPVRNRIYQHFQTQIEQLYED